MEGWRERLLEALRLQLGGSFGEQDTQQLEQTVASMERYLDSAVGEGCAAVLEQDPRLLTIAALHGQVLYDPLGVTLQQQQMLETVIRNLSEQLRCEYRRATAQEACT